MTSILIKHCLIATMDKGRNVYRDGSILIEADRIVEVAKTDNRRGESEFVIDARNMIALPGFVNAHAHLQQYFRGVYELIGEFYTVNLPLEGYRRPEDMEQLGLASCAELIFSGCTTSVVIYTYPEGFAEAVATAGNRTILGADIEEVDLDRLREGTYKYLPEKGEAAFKRATALHDKWHGASEGRITTIMAPKAADLATPETYQKSAEYAEKHGLDVSTHLSQSWREVTQVNKLYSKTPPEHLHALGVLNHRLRGAHCTYATDKDLDLIRASGMSILHCRAVSNPLSRWIETGIPVALGTDDYFHNMIQLMRDVRTGAINRARLVGGADAMLASSPATATPSIYDILELATRRGAEALHIDDEVGSLEPGKKADIILVNMMNPFLTPTMDPLTSLVLYGTSSDIDTVIVDGRILKQHCRLTTINMAEELPRAQQRVEEIISHFFEDFPEQRKTWQSKALSSSPRLR